MLAAATIMGVAAVIERLGPRLDFQRWYGANPGNGGTFLLTGGSYRAGSFVYDPLILGFYLAAATPFAVALAVVRRRWRAAVFLGVAACVGGLIVTLARSAYIGGGIGALVALSMSVRNPGIRLSLVGITIVIAGTVSLSYLAAGNATLVRPDSNVAHQNALERDYKLVLARPFGYGLGTTDRNRTRAGADAGQLGATESSYMAKALEGGVQGLMLYLVALFVTAMRVRSVRLRARRAGDRAGTALAAGAIGAILAVAIAGFFLGVHELVVEVLLWGAPGLALAWPIATERSASVAPPASATAA
jgi:hypothetical protein